MFKMSKHYLMGFALALTLYLVIFFFRRFLISQMKRFKKQEHNHVDDFFVFPLAHTNQMFMIVTSLYFGFKFLPEYKKYNGWSWNIFFVILMFQIGIWGKHLIKRWFMQSFSRRQKRDPASANSLSIVELMIQGTFLIILLMFTLHNVGIKITTMIAGLGVGGIAVALALQNILGDLFSSLSIILDKPFVIGDFIVVGEWMGEVEYIGLKTTRIRSLSGEQIIISNSDLIKSRIRNMKRMSERRNVVSVSLSQETTSENLKKAVEIITAVVSSKDLVRLDRCHFSKITLNSLELELVYFIKRDDYNLHMDLQQDILLDVHKIFLTEGIRYAQPLKIQPVLISAPIADANPSVQ
jgi:small-conductance mechanosensitive channel